MSTTSLNLRSSFVALAAMVLFAQRAQAQATTTASNPVGVWRGTSKCLVRPSPCRDEVVVYRITRLATDSVSIDARKIVDGSEEEMGLLACRLAPGASITCTMRNGVWRFTVRRDSLVGELRLPDDRKFRDVRTARSR
jgi:hypothetical protein